MDFAAIMKLVNAAIAASEAAAPLIDAAQLVLTSDDQAELNAAKDRLAAANDQLHERLQNKLAAAATNG
jgi:hypothetical protein